MKNFFIKIAQFIKNNKAKSALYLLLNMSFVTICVGASTYAWIVSSRKVAEVINIESGSLNIDSITTNVYRYDYTELASGYYDYNNGQVNGHTFMSGSYNYPMNLYDPVYLYINPSATLSDLLTNLVLKIDVTITSNCDYNFNLYANRKTTTIPDTYEDGIGNYLDFVGIDQATLDAQSISIDEPTAAETIFFKAKKYGENESTTKVSFRDQTPYLDRIALLENSSKVTSTGVNKTVTTSLYLFFDYNQASLEKYVTENLFLTLKFYMDYGISIKANQVF